MPKTRLHTKWDPKDARWKLYLSMRNDPERVAEDILDNNEPLDLEDSKAISAFLRSSSEYKEESKREDQNRKAILNGKAQLADYGLFLDRILQIISASSLALIINITVDITYKQQQVKNNSTITYEQARNQSVSNLITTFCLAILVVIGQYYLSHIRRHKLNNASHAYAYKKELLKLLPAIKKEVQRKNRILIKIENFLKVEDDNFSLQHKYANILEYKDLDTADPEKGKSSDMLDMKKPKSVTYKDHLIFAIDKKDDLLVWTELEDTLSRILYQETVPIILSQMRTLFIKKYHLHYSKEFERKNMFKDIKSIKEFFNEFKDFYDTRVTFLEDTLTINSIFSIFIKTIRNYEKLIAQAILFKNFTVALNNLNKNFEEIQLQDKLSTLLNEEIKSYEISTKEKLKYIVDLKPYQSSLRDFFESQLKKDKEDILAVITYIVKNFDKSMFLHITARRKNEIYENTFEPYINSLFFLKNVSRSEKTCVLPDNKVIKVLAKKKALGDGNCGFRAILGGNYLTNKKGLFKRSGVIELLKSSIDNPVVKELIAKDLEAKYQEYVANIADISDMPQGIKKQFIDFKAAAETTGNDLSRQAEITQRISHYCQRKKVLITYLNEYLINDHHWPHVQGSLAAFGYICNIKIHCIQSMPRDSKHSFNWLQYIDIERPKDANYIEEVFILLNKKRNHFDQVIVCELHDQKEHAHPINSNRGPGH